MPIPFEQLPSLVAQNQKKLDELIQKFDIFLNGYSPNSINKPLTVKTLSEKLGKSKSTIYRLCSQRKIPHSKTEGTLYFNENKIDEWISSQERHTISNH